MQNIPYDVIGTSLSQIRHGHPEAAPPIHIWIEKYGDYPDHYFDLGIVEFWEHMEPGRKTPSAVLMVARDKFRGGGPLPLYWIEKDDDKKYIKEWLGEPAETAMKIRLMGIGNHL